MRRKLTNSDPTATIALLFSALPYYVFSVPLFSFEYYFQKKEGKWLVYFRRLSATKLITPMMQATTTARIIASSVDISGASAVVSGSGCSGVGSSGVGASGVGCSGVGSSGIGCSGVGCSGWIGVEADAAGPTTV